jgi:aminoglycoside 6'-N-acetyltransferase
MTSESPPVVALREMTLGDLRDVLRWRREPHVARWFDARGPVTREEVEARYGPRITGEDPTRMWVVEANGRSVGMLQDYLISDHPEFAVLTPDPAAVGVDYLIGEPAWLRRGIGAGMLRRWFGTAHDGYPEATTFFAAPNHLNVASRQLLLRVGFTEGAWFDEPQPDGSVATLVGHSLAVASVLG